MLSVYRYLWGKIKNNVFALVNACLFVSLKRIKHSRSIIAGIVWKDKILFFNTFLDEKNIRQTNNSL